MCLFPAQNPSWLPHEPESQVLLETLRVLHTFSPHLPTLTSFHSLFQPHRPLGYSLDISSKLPPQGFFTCYSLCLSVLPLLSFPSGPHSSVIFCLNGGLNPLFKMPLPAQDSHSFPCLRFLLASITLTYLPSIVPTRMSTVQRQGFVSVVHGCVLIAWNSSWHTIGTQGVFVECVKEEMCVMIKTTGHVPVWPPGRVG